VSEPQDTPTDPVDMPLPDEPAVSAEVLPDDAEPAADPPRRFDVGTDTDEALAAAQAAIAAGECIVLPTDTVYGIGADAFSAAAVQRLLDAKQRGRDMPPPVLVAETGMLEALADDLPASALRLAEAFWPGPLTLIVPAQKHLRMDLGETRGSIAVRVPDHDFTRDLLRRTGPLAVSSANVSGRPAATEVADAADQLGDSVAVYLDAGSTPGATASTIVDFVSETMGRIVRHGVLTTEQLREVDPFVIDPDEIDPDETAAEQADPEPVSDPS